MELALQELNRVRVDLGKARERADTAASLQSAITSIAKHAGVAHRHLGVPELVDAVLEKLTVRISCLMTLTGAGSEGVSGNCERAAGQCRTF